jgi:hypothetical protein
MMEPYLLSQGQPTSASNLGFKGKQIEITTNPHKGGIKNKKMTPFSS